MRFYLLVEYEAEDDVVLNYETACHRKCIINSNVIEYIMVYSIIFHIKAIYSKPREI